MAASPETTAPEPGWVDPGWVDPGWVVMARVAAPFGIKGWVKVQPFCEDIGLLLEATSWRVGKAGGAREIAVELAQDHGSAVVAKLAGIEDRDAAFALRGMEISLPRTVLPAAAENEFYWSDLIGLRVLNTQGVELGRVVSLMETGAHDVMVIRGEREHLIPFVSQFVGEVDVATGTLNVDWGEDY